MLDGRLSGGWLHFVDERGEQPFQTHARENCRAVEQAELRAVLVPYGTRPPLPEVWEPCELCGGARPAFAEKRQEGESG
jgi:hypothetical protein